MPWYNVHEITACKQQKAGQSPGNDKEVIITILFSKSLILYWTVSWMVGKV